MSSSLLAFWPSLGYRGPSFRVTGLSARGGPSPACIDIKICLYALTCLGDPMHKLLQGLRAMAEPTRLRILRLCARGEFTGSDLVQILGQSQPRVSRHLRLLVEAGLLDRHQEGNWAWYRIAPRGSGADLARLIADRLPEDDPRLALDLERLERIKQSRAEKASEY